MSRPIGTIAARKSGKQYGIRKGRAYKTRVINGVPFITRIL
jgi:hypothetical protein